MNRYRFFTAINWVVALLLTFSACTNDEPMDPNALPEGKYPLEIASVTMSVESSSEPWGADAPQTRVTENADGNSSVWQNGDKIKVQIGSGTPGTYTYQDGSLTVADGDAPAYWASKNENQSIRAWYTSSGNETVELSDQFGGLAYVLTSNTTASFNQPVSLSFDHALAKVRMVLNGSQAKDVTKVEVYNYTRCSHDQGTVKYNDTDKGWIQMMPVKENGVTKYLEANVVSGVVIGNVKVNDTEATLTTSLTPAVAAVNTIDLTVGEPILKDGETITKAGTYTMQGSYTQGITINGNGITLTLDGVTVNTSGGTGGINILSGNPTIRISGANNNISCNPSKSGAGIYVVQGSSVTITGNSTNDVLTVTGGSGSCGIGGYLSDDDYTYVSHPCGNITIENITVKATSNIAQVTGGYAAAIGATGDKTVGSIKISNAVVYAHGGGTAHYGGAAIGGGTDGGTGQTSFDITISDSEIHVSKGCPYASYIGSGGAINSMQMNYKIIPSAKITNSIIYDESGMEITQ